jgi:diguanylate cyclase (GGDEF)-like protein/PAS domain S-box-containing protein
MKRGPLFRFGRRPETSEEEGLPRLLIVDDEPRQVSSLVALLDGEGFRISTAVGGASAIRILSELPIDIVLIDLNMPDVGGLDVMEFISQQALDVTVLVLSGEKDIESAISALRLRAYAFLRKPYQVEILLATLRQASARRHLEKENRAAELRLVFSEQWFRFLAETCPAIIYRVDATGRMTYINARVSDLLGFRADALIGQFYSVLVPDEEAERARYVFQERRIGPRASKNVEIKVRCNNAAIWDGRLGAGLRPVSFTSMAIYDGSQQSANRQYLGTYGIARDLSESKAAEAMISFHANHDTLTGLPNRMLFCDRLEVAILQARRKSVEVAVMFIDLDRFKAINDSLGHLKGDELLRQVAMRLKRTARKADTLARFGGDEFVLLLSEMTERRHAALVAEKFIQCLSEPFDLGGRLLNVSASIGIAVYPQDGETSDALLRHADMAMYQVKAAGRNAFAFFDSTSNDVAQHKTIREESIGKALSRDALEMRYQPRIDSHGRGICGVEALLRWNDPRAGLLHGRELLASIEGTGVTAQINQWMLDTICRDLREWHAAGHRTGGVAIKFSPAYLDTGGFLEQLDAQVMRFDIAPSDIELEITERLFAHDQQSTIERLKKLAARGFRFALGEFGTDRSSLGLLHRLPIHALKVDQSFVSEINDKDGVYPAVLATISLANSLGLRPVAEGVSTRMQSDYLAAAGCGTMQGDLFFRPLTQAEAAQAMVAAPPRAGMANTA